MKRIAMLMPVVFVAVFCLSLAVLQEAPAQMPGGLGGPAFSDPTKVYEMPEEWVEQSIEYEPEAAGADLAVTLDQHLYPALLPLIQEFAREKAIKVSVREGTCGTSAGRLAKKAVDVAGFCCPPGEFDRLPGLEFHTIGVEAVALIVHPDNPVGNMTLEDARRAFQGLVYRWGELGGKDVTVQPVGRLHCKLRPGHWRLLLDNEDLFSPRLKEVGAIPDMIVLVASNPGAIGYEALQMVRLYEKEGRVKMLRINGLDPADPKNLRSGKYPLYRTLGITTWRGKGVENPLALGLVGYLYKNLGRIDPALGIVTAPELRKAGWKFRGDELVGEPE